MLNKWHTAALENGESDVEALSSRAPEQDLNVPLDKLNINIRSKIRTFLSYTEPLWPNAPRPFTFYTWKLLVPTTVKREHLSVEKTYKCVCFRTFTEDCCERARSRGASLFHIIDSKCKKVISYSSVQRNSDFRQRFSREHLIYCQMYRTVAALETDSSMYKNYHHHHCSTILNIALMATSQCREASRWNGVETIETSNLPDKNVSYTV